jgi:hypothetical protein
MVNLAKIIGTGVLFLTLGAGLASATDPDPVIRPITGIGGNVRQLLLYHSHETVLEAINESECIEQINKKYYPSDDNQDSLYEVSMLFAEYSNPATAVRFASGLKDLNKRYDVAEILITFGNPRNGVNLLEPMPDKYKLVGIKLLEQTGNFGNARLLRSKLSH